MGKTLAAFLAGFLMVAVISGTASVQSRAETDPASGERTSPTEVETATAQGVPEHSLGARIRQWLGSWFKKSEASPEPSFAELRLPASTEEKAAREKTEEEEKTKKYEGLVRMPDMTCGKQRGSYYSTDGTYGKPNAAYLREMSTNQYNETARKIAKRFGLDPDLFTALLFAESSGLNKEPDMTNPYDSFAQGLVQVSHAVMKDVHRWTNDKRFHVTCPKKWDETCNPRKHPEINMEAGARYLAWLQKRCKGDTLCTTLSYNIGPGTYDAVKAGRKPLSCEGNLYTYKIIGIPGSKIRPGTKVSDCGSADFLDESGGLFADGFFQTLSGAIAFWD